ncbi:aminotransferase class I/II-fold pyridoxal phosphate-dependent enzyme [Nitrosococcus watsonii]|uniref:Aminotransferase class I and II n=1 Tax=Nitrosococcus watsoni (strain C-113) TaxID=105559 RepID=D8K9K4_NITWC|nr:aminotransferase class I/II-fold pyridoxal phosphate-dependent enzyme [Nitrosococcus watsonii]ADJ27293.1 aminotransferase class I and II [Nitrosococcus watsonii C-113]
MLDFTSVLYLGLRHSSGVLRPWTQLTSGKPAALITPAAQHRVAGALAELQGCEEATIGPSTLHLFWDLFGILAKQGMAIYLDGGTYPIARWGVERAAARGIPVRRFPHRNPEALRRRLKQDSSRGLRPLVVADGFCPGCGKPIPLHAYLESARDWGGYLLLDDTQALGILGYSPSFRAPYGREGGGSLPWHHAAGSDVLLVSSLAKGFGVPMAVLAGSHALIRWFKDKSETRTHCSPPSIAIIHAAEHALKVNKSYGDGLRLRLARLVHYFRSRLAQIGWPTVGGLFPVQTLMPKPTLDARKLHEQLLRQGIQTVLHRGRKELGACLSFLITARHSRGDIDRAANAVARFAGKRDPQEISHEYCL